MRDGRFLNRKDYLGIITDEALTGLVRGNEDRFMQAEEAAEISMLEYLSENYEIERELALGKGILGHDRRISYPVGVHILIDDSVYRVVRAISGLQAPMLSSYWVEADSDCEDVRVYSQMLTYYPGDVVLFNGVVYVCHVANGYDLGDIRIPGVCGWKRVECRDWQPVEYDVFSVVGYRGIFYALITVEGYDATVSPDMAIGVWGEIADYDRECNDYELSEHEFVIYEDVVFVPEMDVNADLVEIDSNVVLHDPRNANVKKHMVRMALYELCKLVAANNVASVRIMDYEASMRWLYDASKLKINPMIPRKVESVSGKAVTDWQLATFQINYNPYQNPWHI